MVSETIKPIILSIAFTNALAWIFGLMGVSEFTFWTLGFFTVSTAVLALAIGLANTPLLKGIAVVALAGDIILYTSSLNIPAPYAGPLFILMTIPNFMAMGLGFLELGKG